GREDISFDPDDERPARTARTTREIGGVAPLSGLGCVEREAETGELGGDGGPLQRGAAATRRGIDDDERARHRGSRLGRLRRRTGTAARRRTSAGGCPRSPSSLSSAPAPSPSPAAAAEASSLSDTRCGPPV